MSEKMITILIADDQTLFRECIKDLLENEKDFKVVGEAGNGPEAVALAKKLKPDVILMDIKLPQMDGIAATRAVRRESPETNVLILSSYEDDAHVTEAIQAGANGYLSKMLPVAELVHALRTFNQEGVMIPQPIMNKLLQHLRTNIPGQVSPPDSLTATEMKVMSLLGKGKTNKDIAEEMGCSVKTIKNHLNSVFTKLGVNNRTEAVVKAIEMNLISADDGN
ncbi:MAG: response regulator transcription factor [Elusimicrobiales bacterium]|jgi:DNA-binding NarL/FixJ family response regulator|nr:response regulator transcription factor [Elusimicrobiales bacterium]